MDIVLKYFENLSDKQVRQIEMLQSLYLDWNEKINVISRKDVQHLYERHVLHSLAIAKIIKFKSQSKVLDVGTGGGFPGIPLAILFPETRFHLIDSVGKKIKVVNEVAKELKLDNVGASHQRVQDNNQRYDFIVSRAVTNLIDFIEMTKGKLRSENRHSLKNGILYLKGGDFLSELEGLKLKNKVFNLDEMFQESFFETKSLVHIYK
jgi:16S rRNA (guanine527-N7)-methyltransferase